MKALSSTESDTQYSIFFSHKANDETITRSIIALFDRHTENIRCFVSEDIEKGTDWRRSIAERLSLSSFLVLVFTDPKEDWGWALYEAGLFDSLSQSPATTSTRRMYVLHHPATTPPAPIADLQSVPATTEDVSQWLSDVFTQTKQNDRTLEDIPQIANAICNIFTNSLIDSSQVLVPELTISLTRGRQISKEAVLSASIHANNYALQVLSLTDGRWTLDDVLRTQSDKAWISELINNVVSIANDRLPVKARHILHTDRSNFIPTMRRLDRINGGRQLSLSVELIEFAGETDSWAFFGRPIASDKWPEVFVLMPFSSDIDPIYRDHITEVVSKKMNLSLKRADDFYTNHAVMQDVWSAIYHAQVIIADCTGKNANVFYEIGIAHTLGKQTILISQKTGDIPFDVQHIRSIVYEYTPRGVREFEKKLEDTLSLVVKQSHD